MAFCTHEEWESRAGDTLVIDRLDGAPGVRMRGCFGVPIVKRWADADLGSKVATDNGYAFDLTPKSRLIWQHLQPRALPGDNVAPPSASSGDAIPGQSPGLLGIENGGPLFEFGGLKETILLDAKPDVPQWRFRLECPADLVWAYQPELTAEEIAEGCVRPPEVVGSYAIFDAWGRKVGHVLRSQAVDADGKSSWLDTELTRTAWGAWLHLAGDQGWFAGAKYPVTIDPTLGYTSVGGTAQDRIATWFAVNNPFTASDNGVTQTGHFYTRKNSSNSVFTLGLGVIVPIRTWTRLVDTGEGSNTSTTPGWLTVDFDSGYSVTSGSVYGVGVHLGTSNSYQYYDLGGLAGLLGQYITYTSGAVPATNASWVTNYGGLSYSWYVTYGTPGATNECTRRVFGRGIGRGIMRGF